MIEKGFMDRKWSMPNVQPNARLDFSLSNAEKIVIELAKEGEEEEEKASRENYERQCVKFFHHYLFCYMFSADHHIYKLIIDKQASFAEVLFKKEITYLRTRQGDKLKTIYELVSSPCFQPQKEMNRLHSYLVPIKRNEFGGFEIDMKLIEHTIQFVRIKLINLFMESQAKQETEDKFDLEKLWTTRPKYIYSSLIDSHLNCCRYVMKNGLKTSKQGWDDNFVELLNPKRGKDPKGLNKSMQGGFNAQFYSSMPTYYFSKSGILLQHNSFALFTKSKKERQFLDFTKSKQSVKPTKEDKVNTLFDLPTEHTSLSPFTIEQYSVF